MSGDTDWNWRLTFTFTDNYQQGRIVGSGHLVWVSDALTFEDGLGNNLVVEEYADDDEQADLSVRHGTLSPTVVVEFNDFAIAARCFTLLRDTAPLSIELTQLTA